MSFHDAVGDRNIGALINAKATTTANVRSLIGRFDSLVLPGHRVVRRCNLDRSKPFK